MTPTRTQQLAAVVDQQLADKITAMARASERSVAAEIRLALRAWADSDKKKAA